jgi:pimeloyl-ACP methyl ester carboxylesterase
VLSDADGLEPDAPLTEQFTTVVLQDGVATMYSAAGNVVNDAVGPGETPTTILSEVAQSLLYWDPNQGPFFSRAVGGAERTVTKRESRDSAGLRLTITEEIVVEPAADAKTSLRSRVRTTEYYRDSRDGLRYLGGQRSTVSLEPDRPTKFDESWSIKRLDGQSDLTAVLDSISDRQVMHKERWKALAQSAVEEAIAKERSVIAGAAAVPQADVGSCTIGHQSVPGRAPHAANAIILQHGIYSDNCTWQRVVPRLDTALAVSRIVSSQTSSFAGIVEQALQLGEGVVNLHPEANPWGPSQYRFAVVGHSQGGLVARTIAGWGEQVAFTWMAGVVTLDTPNEGAKIAEGLSLPVGISALIIGGEATFTYGLLSPVALAASAVAVGFVGPVARVLACPVISPLYCDLLPGSQLLTDMNTFPVTFRRTAIVHDVRRRWAGFRWLGDAVLCNGEVREDTCGPRIVHRVEYMHRSYLWCAAVALWIPFLGDLRERCKRNAAAMNTADVVWNTAVGGPNTSDGFIATPSQWYPGVPHQEQYYYPGAVPSHAGLTRHRLTAGKICVALVGRIAFTRNQGQPCPPHL